MKLDKRFFLTAILTAGLAFGAVACGDDDDDKKKDESSQDNCKPEQNCTPNDGDDKPVACSNDEACAEIAGAVCVNSVCSLCGNGVVDEGELCDLGPDHQKFSGSNADDDVWKAGADVTCSAYGAASTSDQNVTWAEGGKPGCSNDCKAYSKGSCVSQQKADEQASEGINGIAKCASGLAINDKTATATVSYTMGSTTADSGVKAAIVCSNASGTVNADVANADSLFVDAASGAATLSRDLSDMTSSVACYVIVKAGDKGAVVCPIAEGDPAKANGEVSNFSNSTVAYTVAAAAGELAVWNNFNINNLHEVIVDPGLEATKHAESITASNLKLVVADGVTVNNQTVKKAQSSLGGSNITALLVGSAVWAADAPTDLTASSRIVITGVPGAKSISIKATTGTDADQGHMVVYADDAKIVEDFHAKKGDWQVASANLDNAESIIIYAYGLDNGNLIIDNITMSSDELPSAEAVPAE